jgi:multiple sugar transport system permease protein
MSATSTATSGRTATTSAPTRAADRHANLRATVVYWTVGVVASLIFIIPLLWVILRSFQSPGVVVLAPSLNSFSHLTLSNYTNLLHGQIGLLHNVVNSLIVSISTSIVVAVLATLAGYGFARFRFRFSGLIFATILVTLMVPFQAILTPLFLELNAMHLTNSLVGLILFYTTFNLPFGVFVMRNTFATIPRELEESAQVDGSNVMQTLFQVLWPLVVPGVATTVLFTFLASWTEFLGALTFLTSPSKATLPVALVNIQAGDYGQLNYGYLVAGSVIAMVPCVVLYLALQRYYVHGLTSGAVKG